MPAFYTRESGFRLPMRVDTPEEAASLFRIARALSYPGGMVVANPVPPEDAMDSETIDRAIANALEDAEREGITGKEISPFLLARIAAETEGDSLRSNIALVRNNARLAADIALAYAKG